MGSVTKFKPTEQEAAIIRKANALDLVSCVYSRLHRRDSLSCALPCWLNNQ